MIYNIGSRVVNNYLVSFDAGFILVDTGYEGGFPHFLKMLEKHHIQPEEIKYLLLTHMQHLRLWVKRSLFGGPEQVQLLSSNSLVSYRSELIR